MIASKPALPLSEIHESATNPRRSFDKAALEELTESVRKHGVLQPILVRPNDQGYELVAGHRRFRAATAAGLDEIPAVVRELGDREVLEIQVVENLQREDLHPLEEAEGYRRLHEEFEYSVDELAAKVGKSKSYVYARMRLCAISGKARKLFLDGKLDASRALLVARIPVPQLAEEAARELADNDWLASYRSAAEHVQRRYMLRLREAPFPANDGDLLPDAGPCKACPKRTGNQRELFGDVQSADVCTDPVCFRKKADEHWQRERAKAEEAGRKVLEGKAASDAAYSGQYVRLNDTCYSDPKHRKWSSLVGRAVAKQPEAVLARSHEQERPQVLIPRKIAIEQLRERGHDFADSMSNSSGSSSSQSREHRAHKRRTAAIALAIEDVVKEAEAFTDTEAFLRFVARKLLGGHADAVKRTAKRRGWGAGKKKRYESEDYSAKLDELNESQLRGVIAELIAMDMPSSTWQSGYGSGWKAACELLGIDMKAYERKVAAATRKKKTVKKKAAPKGKTRRRTAAKKTKRKATKKKT